MGLFGRVLKRASQIRRLVPRRPSRMRGKIRVIFVCKAGQESSLAGRGQFENLLRAKGLAGRFKVDHVGWSDRKPGGFEADLRSADFIVPVFPLGQKTTPPEMATAKVKKKIIDVKFQKLNDEYDKTKYEQILKIILG